MRYRNSLAIVVAVAALLTVPNRARAQTDPTTAQLQHGVELRAAGDDAGALAEFRRAYDVSHSPLALAQMGLAEQALGRWVDAENHVRSALAVQGDRWIDRHRDALTASYAVIQQHVGRLQIVGGLGGAEVEVSGVRRGTLPLNEPLVVLVGDATVVVRVAGSPARSHTVTVTAGSVVRDALSNASAPAASAIPTAAAETPHPLTDRESGSRSNALPIGVAAGAVVFLGVGVAGMLLRESIVGGYNDRCRGFGDTMPPMNCEEAMHTSSAASAGALGATGLIAGGLLGVVAVVLFAMPSRSGDERTPQAFRCGAGPGDIGISCGRSF